jgi:hypothetical protein
MKKWDSGLKSQKYKQQLYFYKLLIEGSHTYSKYQVVSARLEFVEPSAQNTKVEPLFVSFDANYEKELREFIAEIWQKIQTLQF